MRNITLVLAFTSALIMLIFLFLPLKELVVNPEITQTELFLSYWHYYLTALLFAFITKLIVKRGK